MKIKKYQEGGAMPAQTNGTPVAQETNPIIEIANVMAQALQSGDCNMAMEACQAFLSFLQQAQEPPAEPIGQAEGQPVFKKGGKMVRRKKCKK